MLAFKKYTANDSPYQLDILLLKNFELSPKLEQSQKERLFIEDICKRVSKSGTVLYLLHDDQTYLGFVSLSATSIGDFPSLQVDYLFVDNRFRGKPLDMLEGEKTSNYLIEFSIKIAKELQGSIGLRYLVLLPENERLEDVYKEMGFSYLPKHKPWMYVKL